MAENENKGVTAFHITGGGDLHLDNVAFVNVNPFKIEDGGVAITKDVIVQKGPQLAQFAQGSRPAPKKPEVDPDDPFYGPKLLLAEGANVHLTEFDQLASGFFESYPYTPLAEIDPETGHKVHKWRATREPPERLRYVAYSAVNDLRNALDQAVCASATLINKAPAKDAYFPFGESPADIDGKLGSKQYADIPDALKPFLRSLQPYPTNDAYEGGDDLLRALGKIANPNKHQIPLALGARNLQGAYAIQHMTATDMADFFDPYWDSAKKEFILAKTGPNGTFNYQLRMPLYIAFGDVGFLSRQPVSAVLNELATKVESIVLGLEAETARILELSLAASLSAEGRRAE